jgi:hypothetical protein
MFYLGMLIDGCLMVAMPEFKSKVNTFTQYQYAESASKDFDILLHCGIFTIIRHNYRKHVSQGL